MDLCKIFGIFWGEMQNFGGGESEKKIQKTLFGSTARRYRRHVPPLHTEGTETAPRKALLH